MVYGNLYTKYKGTNIFNEYKENDISDSLLEEDVIFESEDNVSLFVETLDFIVNENVKYSIFLYESFGDRLREQIKRISPNGILSTIIDKFIDILKAIWNRFESLCMSILSKAGAIKRYSSSIMKLSDPIMYRAPHYNYTNIREDKSRTNFDIEVNTTYNEFLNQLDCIKSMGSYGDIQSKIQEYNEKFNYGLSYLDSLRGKILGKEICSQDEFAKELYKYFRAGQSTPIEEESISADRIKTMLSSLESKKNTKAISKTKSEIEKQAGKMKVKYKTTKLEEYIGNNDNSTDIVSVYKKCIENNITKTQSICNIYLQYYAAKLDAAKEEYSNDLHILYAAAQEAVRRGL